MNDLLRVLFVILLVGLIYWMMLVVYRKMFNKGNILIDNSDPNEQPYMFLEISVNPNELKDNRYIVLKVKKKNFITHE